MSHAAKAIEGYDLTVLWEEVQVLRHRVLEAWERSAAEVEVGNVKKIAKRLRRGRLVVKCPGHAGRFDIKSGVPPWHSRRARRRSTTASR